MGAGAAGCAMDRPRLLLLLLGVSAAGGDPALLPGTGALGVRVSPREHRTERWAPRCWDGGREGSSDARAHGGASGSSGRREDPEVRGGGAPGWMRALGYRGGWCGGAGRVSEEGLAVPGARGSLGEGA